MSPYHFEHLNLFLLIEVELFHYEDFLFNLSTFEYLISLSLSFFFRFKFQTDSRHSKNYQIRAEMLLFAQFRNKNIKGMERNFKVGLFLFSSGNAVETLDLV